jgi:hypothetical protein
VTGEKDARIGAQQLGDGIGWSAARVHAGPSYDRYFGLSNQINGPVQSLHSCPPCTSARAVRTS